MIYGQKHISKLESGQKQSIALAFEFAGFPSNKFL